MNKIGDCGITNNYLDTYPPTSHLCDRGWRYFSWLNWSMLHRSKVGWGGQLAAHKRRVAADMHPSTVWTCLVFFAKHKYYPVLLNKNVHRVCFECFSFVHVGVTKTGLRVLICQGSFEVKTFLQLSVIWGCFESRMSYKKKQLHENDLSEFYQSRMFWVLSEGFMVLWFLNWGLSDIWDCLEHMITKQSVCLFFFSVESVLRPKHFYNWVWCEAVVSLE